MRRKPGPTTQWVENILGRFPAGTMAAIEDVLEPKEVRTAFIRAAVKREIAWRKRQKKRKVKP